MNKHSHNRIRVLATALCLAVVFACPALAVWVDTGRTCSLSLEAKEGDVPMAGMTFAIRQVASMDHQGRYALLGDYAASGVELNGLETAGQWKEAGDALAAYTAAGSLPVQASRTADHAGKAVFTGLAGGVYLVTADTVQVNGLRYAVAPYLLAVPGWAPEGGWLYDVVSLPKCERTPDSDKPDGPDVIPTVNPVTPGQTPGGKLPQTGQLKWPVPVLAAAGMVLMGVGFALNRRRDD